MNTYKPRYKVVSTDGHAQGTKIIDLETGEPIKGVTKIVLRADCNDVWRAEVHLIGVSLDVSTFDSEAFREFVSTRPASPSEIQSCAIGMANNAERVTKVLAAILEQLRRNAP